VADNDLEVVPGLLAFGFTRYGSIGLHFDYCR
jgi:hypothetical protein